MLNFLFIYTFSANSTNTSSPIINITSPTPVVIITPTPKPNISKTPENTPVPTPNATKIPIRTPIPTPQPTLKPTLPPPTKIITPSISEKHIEVAPTTPTDEPTIDVLTPNIPTTLPHNNSFSQEAFIGFLLILVLAVVGIIILYRKHRNAEDNEIEFTRAIIGDDTFEFSQMDTI